MLYVFIKKGLEEKKGIDPETADDVVYAAAEGWSSGRWALLFMQGAHEIP